MADIKKHAVYLTVDELTDIIIAYDGSIVLSKQNQRQTDFPHMKQLYAESIIEKEIMMKKLIEIRNEIRAKEEC